MSLLPAAEFMYSDRGRDGSGVFPAADLVREFWDLPDGHRPADFAPKDERKLKMWNRMKPSRELAAGTSKNIVWRATIPHWGHNGVVVIKDRAFLLYEEGWKTDCPMLLCLDVHTGKTLWDKPVDHLDALTGSEQATAKEIKRFASYMKWHNRIFYDNKKLRWKTKEEAEKDFPPLQAAALADGWKFNNSYLPGGYSRTRSRYGIKVGNLKKDGGVPVDQSLIDNYKTVREQRWHQRQGWTTEQPWYGNTHGSVISDGTYIYAVTALGGAAAYDVEGKQLWAQWLRPETYHGRPGGGHGNIASPVICAGTVLYFHRDGMTLFGLDAKTGQQRYAVRTPMSAEYKGKPAPQNYSGHMGPGSSPVVLDLSGEKVVVTGNGMVVRVRDGHLLGMLKGSQHTYFDMVGTKDIYVMTLHVGETKKTRKRKFAGIRLGIDGDALTQERLWISPEGTGNWEKSSSLALDGEHVFYRAVASSRNSKVSGLTKVRLQDGAVVKSSGAISEYWAMGDNLYISRSGSLRETRYRALRLTDKQSLKPVGWGFLVEPPASGEIAERHISFLGWPEIWTGYSRVTMWGNRIFVRTNDYVWCVGDPAKPFSAPAPISK